MCCNKDCSHQPHILVLSTHVCNSTCICIFSLMLIRNSTFRLLYISQTKTNPVTVDFKLIICSLGSHLFCEQNQRVDNCRNKMDPPTGSCLQAALAAPGGLGLCGHVQQRWQLLCSCVVAPVDSVNYHHAGFVFGDLYLET